MLPTNAPKMEVLIVGTNQDDDLKRIFTDRKEWEVVQIKSQTAFDTYLTQTLETDSQPHLVLLTGNLKEERGGVIYSQGVDAIVKDLVALNRVSETAEPFFILPFAWDVNTFDVIRKEITWARMPQLNLDFTPIRLRTEGQDLITKLEQVMWPQGGRVEQKRF